MIRLLGFTTNFTAMRLPARLPSAIRIGLGSLRNQRLVSTSYDSQSGKTVTLPSGIQCHVDLSAVAVDRHSSALRHLVKDGQPVSGLSSIMRAVADDEHAVAEAAQNQHSGVCVMVASRKQGVAAVAAARSLDMRAWAVLQPTLCSEPHDVQLNAAEIGDAGAEAILLSVDAGLDPEKLREMVSPSPSPSPSPNPSPNPYPNSNPNQVDMACEIDLLGVPMRSRLGLRVAPAAGAPAAGALKLVQFAYEELGLLHHVACLAGKHSPRPSEILKAAGLGPLDANFGPIFLAEFVPEAA